MNMRMIVDKPKTICAIDASTRSLAFAIVSTEANEKFPNSLDSVGKIEFEGQDIYQKVMDASKKTKAFFDYYGGFDAIVIEHTVFMNSPKVAADLALVQGALLGAAGLSGTRFIGKVSPITWQIYIGNGKFTKAEKAVIRTRHPNYSEAWYKAFERTLRKQRTIDFINEKFDKNITDNDVADACGIGYWSIHNLDKAFGVDE